MGAVPDTSHPASSSLNRQVLFLAVPALGALIAEPLFVLADSAMVGHLGAVSLAGLSLASTILTTTVGLFVFLAYATTATTARLFGAGRRSEGLRAGVDGMWLALLLGLGAGAFFPWAIVLKTSTTMISALWRFPSTNPGRLKTSRLPSLTPTRSSAMSPKPFFDTSASRRFPELYAETIFPERESKEVARSRAVCPLSMAFPFPLMRTSLTTFLGADGQSTSTVTAEPKAPLTPTLHSPFAEWSQAVKAARAREAAAAARTARARLTDPSLP